MFGSNKDLGFLKYVDEDNDVEGSVKEVWERNCLQQPLVRGTTVYICCTCNIKMQFLACFLWVTGNFQGKRESKGWNI